MRKFIHNLNFQLRLSPAVCLLIEIVSSLQILYLIVNILHSSTDNPELVLLALYRAMPFVTGALEVSDLSTTSVFIKPIWIVCIVYLILHVLLVPLVSISIRYKRTRAIAFRYLPRPLALLSLFHSRLLFFPIQFFFFSVINLLNTTDNINQYFVSKTVFIILTIIASIANHAFAFIKEFVFYQVLKNRNFYAVKTNIYHKILILYKTVALFLYLFSNDQKGIAEGSSVLLLLVSITLLCVLYKTLPFYKFMMLKTAVITASLMLGLSIISLIQVNAKDQMVYDSVQVLCLLIPSAVVKAVLSIFRYLLQKIARGEAMSCEYSVHFALLFNELRSTQKTSLLVDKQFFPHTYTLIGTLTRKREINLSNLQEKKGDKTIIYNYIIERLEHELKKNPNSQLLLLFMAQVYLKKLRNIPKAIELIKKIEGQLTTFSMRSSLSYFKMELEKIYTQEYLSSKVHLQLDNYFKFNTITKTIRTNMVMEIDKHLEFWHDLERTDPDVKKMVQKVLRIDYLAQKVKRHFEANLNDFAKHFPSSVLLYAVYLNNIRQEAREASKISNRYHRATLIEAREDDLGIYTGNTAVILISIDRHNPGEVIDASGSVQNIFDIKKTELIGRNFGFLFPTIIAKSYQNIVIHYSKSLDFKLDYKSKTFGKMVNGDLFEMEANFQLYPYLNKEITLLLLLKKKSEPKQLFIANHDGSIVDCSKSLEEGLQKANVNLSTFRQMQDIAYEFEQINTAFNQVYREENCSKIEEPMTGMNQDHPGTVTFRKSETVVTSVHDNVKLTQVKTLPLIEGSFNFDSPAFYTSTKAFQTTHKDFGSTVKTLFKVDRPYNLRDVMRRDNEDEMSIEEARSICKKFTRGQKIVFSGTTSPLIRKPKLKANVQVQVYVLEHEIFKIVTFTHFQKENITLWQDEDMESSESAAAVAVAAGNAEDDEFADAFPDVEERRLLTPQMLNHDTGTLHIINQDTGHILIQDTETKSQIPNQETKSLISGPPNFVSPLHVVQEDKLEEEKEVQLKVIQFIQRKEGKDNTKLIEEDQKHSVMDSTHKEIRVEKTLRMITERQNIHPYLKSSIYVVYSVLVGVIVLIGVDFYLSQQSVSDIDRGIKIVNAATLRLQGVVASWQYALILYTIEIGIFALPPQLIPVVKFKLKGYISDSTINNNKFKEELSLTRESSLLSHAYSKNTKMWITSGWQGTSYDSMDTFISNDMLIGQYSGMISLYEQGKLSKTGLAVQAFNNTANDYIVVSRELVSKTEELLQNTVDRSFTVLQTVFIIQVVGLVMLVGAFGILFFVTVQTYKRLFKALLRTPEQVVSARISEIRRVKALFEEDIETYSFPQHALDFFEHKRAKPDAKKQKKFNVLAKEKKYEMRDMNVYLLKYIVMGLLFVPIFLALFATMLITSKNAFKTFENTYQQVAILSQASYQGDIILSTLFHSIAFYNQTSMTLYNQPPKENLYKEIDHFGDIAERLIYVILGNEDEAKDEVIEGVFIGNLCHYLDAATQSDCKNSTKDGTIGLLGVTKHYIQVGTDTANGFYQLPWFINGRLRLSIMFLTGVNDMRTVKAAYPFLVNYVMDKFENQAKDTLSQQLGIFLGICAVVIIYLLYLHFACLETIKRIDLGRRKVLKIIPYVVLQENKALSFYLVKDFEREVGNIKNLL